MKEKGGDLAFIVGHYKAGSTWLLRLLSLHPGVRGVGETHIFRFVSESLEPAMIARKITRVVPWSRGGLRGLPAYRAKSLIGRLLRRGAFMLPASERPNRLLDFSVFQQKSLEKRIRRCDSSVECCKEFFDFLFEALHPRDFIVEKTPTHMPYVPLIKEIFPDAKLVAVYRDGRDVVVSGKFHQMRLNKDWSLEQSAITWRQSMAKQLEYERDFGLHTLSYESLHERGESVVRRLLDFMQIASSDDTIADLLHRSSFEFVTGRKPGEENVRRFDRKGIVGDWVNHFSEADKTTFKRVANDMLVELGYEKDDAW